MIFLRQKADFSRKKKPKNTHIPPAVTMMGATQRTNGIKGTSATTAINITRYDAGIVAIKFFLDVILQQGGAPTISLLGAPSWRVWGKEARWPWDYASECPWILVTWRVAIEFRNQ